MRKSIKNFLAFAIYAMDVSRDIKCPFHGTLIAVSSACKGKNMSLTFPN